MPKYRIETFYDMHSRSHAIDEIGARNNILPILSPHGLAGWLTGVRLRVIGMVLIVEHNSFGGNKRNNV